MNPDRDPTPRGFRRIRSARRPLVAVATGTLIVLAASACGGAPPRPLPDQSPDAYSGIGVDADRIDYAVGKIKDIVEEEMDASDVPGVAVAVVYDGEVVLQQGFGVREAGAEAPVGPDTVFPLGSASEPVSATVAAAGMTAADGAGGAEAGAGASATATTDTASPDTEALDWSTPVVDLLPWFALSDQRITPMVTVGDLFAHRSGLPSDDGVDLAELGYDRPAILHGLRHLPLGPFRASFADSDAGLTAGATAVARAAGSSWDDLAQERLLDPLQMSHTSFTRADYLDRDDRAREHVRATNPDTGRATGTWTPSDAESATATTSPSATTSATDSTGAPDATTAPDSTAPDATAPDATTDRVPAPGEDALAPARGVSTSAADMARWMTMVLADGAGPGGSPVVPAGALREALTPHSVSTPPASADERPNGFGYGFEVTTSSAGRVQWGRAGGTTDGAAASILMLPSLDLGIVALTNAAPVGAAESITARFADHAQFGDAVFVWRDHYGPRLAPALEPTGDLVTQHPPSSPEPHAPLDELVGVYRDGYLGEVHIARDGDTLTLRAGRRAAPWPLRHWNGDTFALAPTGAPWNPGSRGSVTFEGDTVTVDLLNGSGHGTFTREAEPNGADGGDDTGTITGAGR